MSAVLVTGGAGFVGSHLVEHLLAAGHTVTIVDNFAVGHENNVAHLRSHPKLTVVKGDILDAELMKRVCEGKAVVFHLAAFTRIQPSIANPRRTVEVNCSGTTAVLQACRLAGVPRVVYAGSSSAYGDRNVSQLASGHALVEDMGTDCRSPYALSKKFGEDMMGLFHQLFGLSTCSLRFFNVYGPRQPEQGPQATLLGIWSQALRSGQPLPVVGDGQQRRDFTHVSDVVRALAAAGARPHVTGVINVGSGRDWGILQLARMLAPDHPIQFLPARPGESHITRADNARALELLDWRPEVRLEDAIVSFRPKPTGL